MSFFTVLSYLPYALVTASTPGPNNILALYVVSRDGWKRGKSALLGISAGFFCVMILCALFCYQLDRYLPTLSHVLKYLGAVYIFWLAVHVARSGPAGSGGSATTFWKGFFLQFVNVKVILYAITVYTAYVLPMTGSLLEVLLHGGCLTIIGISGFALWGAAGSFLQGILASHPRLFNYTMGGILALCAVSLLV